MVPSEVVFVLFVNQAGMGSEDRYCDRRFRKDSSRYALPIS